MKHRHKYGQRVHQHNKFKKKIVFPPLLIKCLFRKLTSKWRRVFLHIFFYYILILIHQ